MAKKPRGYFELSDEELQGTEIVFNTLTILESRGYQGFVELMSLLNDPTIILKIVRFLYGMEIKVPPLDEFNLCLRTALFAYCDMHKNVNASLPVKTKDIQQFMNIDDDETKKILEVFDAWAKYMGLQGKSLNDIMHINRNNTKKRIKMAENGKKWTAAKY